LLEAILTRLTGIEERLVAVGTYIAARPDMNPLWENIYKEVADNGQRLPPLETELRKELRHLGNKMDGLALGALNARTLPLRDVRPNKMRRDQIAVIVISACLEVLHKNRHQLQERRRAMAGQPGRVRKAPRSRTDEQALVA
jgi:hypothetical protein